MIRMRNAWISIGILSLVCLVIAGCTTQRFNQASVKSHTASSTEVVLDWATQTTLALYRYTPCTYGKDLASHAHYFTAKGFLSYQQTLQQSGLIHQISKQHASSSAQMITAPNLLAHGKDKAYYTWVVRIPVLLVVKHNKILKTKHMHVVLRIIQGHAFIGRTDGLRIEHFLAKPYTEFKK